MAKRVQKRRAKVNVPICAAGILLCLTLFSVHLTSGIYARYTTTASGSDSARVISFGDITLTDTGAASMIVAPGAPIAREVSVSFTGSESATYVFVEVIAKGTWYSADNTNFSAVGNKISWKMASGWDHVTTTDNSDGTRTYVYYRALDPGDTLVNAPIMTGGYTVSESLVEAELSSLYGGNFAVNFRASVVQSIGFNSVKAAWDSVKAH